MEIIFQILGNFSSFSKIGGYILIEITFPYAIFPQTRKKFLISLTIHTDLDKRFRELLGNSHLLTPKHFSQIPKKFPISTNCRKCGKVNQGKVDYSLKKFPKI